jgi:ClpP class serine protease
MVNDKVIYQQIMEEKNQSHTTRKKLYNKINKILGVPLVSYFTSFRYPVMIENADADLLEGILQKIDVSNGFALFISSPGGDGLAAERIINICRAYSGTKEYTAIIPGKAKSAATMICLGASKLIMSETSELGPIDPQYVQTDESGKSEIYSAYSMIMSYKKIFERAITTTGRMEPFLQALNTYDAKQIELCITELELSQDIAVKALKSGMLNQMEEDEITRQIKIFLIPKETKVHGRPIYYKDIKDSNLKIEIKESKDELWSLLYELYLRLNIYTSTNNIGKCLESENNSFITRTNQGSQSK